MEKSLSSIPLLCIETSISLSSTSMSHQVELINTNFTSLTPAESAPFYPFSWNSFSCLTSRGTRASYWSLLPVHSPHCCCSGHPEAQTRSSLPTSPCSYIYIYRLKCFQGVPSAQHEVRTPQSLNSQLLPLFPGLTPRALLHRPMLGLQTSHSRVPAHALHSAWNALPPLSTSRPWPSLSWTASYLVCLVHIYETRACLLQYCVFPSEWTAAPEDGTTWVHPSNRKLRQTVI